MHLFIYVFACRSRVYGTNTGGRRGRNVCIRVALLGGRMFTCTFLQLLVGCLPAEKCGLVGISRHRMRYGGVSFRWSAVGEVAGEDDAGGFI